jgi:hypothetical protein
MNRSTQARLMLLGTLLVGLLVMARLQAEDKPKPQSAGSGPSSGMALAVKPKPLSAEVQKGLTYLVGQQRANGGWGQGGGWRTSPQGGRIEGASVEDPPDVASTCISTLALLRAGNTPQHGPYANNVARAIEFICSHVEQADKDSLYVTDVRGTQVQSKIGPYVDTFLASLVMAEMKDKMPNGQGQKRLVAALTKTVAKIEKNQKEDGTFAGNTGWASIFSQALCCKGLNRASQNGIAVKGETLARADVKGGGFAAPVAGGYGGEGRALALAGRASGVAGRPALSSVPAAAAPSDAGVAIYNVSNNVASLQESVNTGKQIQEKARRTLADGKASKKEREQAQAELGRIAKLEETQKVAVDATLKQLGDKQFLQGFGSNGGEEFLSYLNLSETLVVQGGEKWTKWDQSVTENLNRIQNQDGSWSGQHCITGKTFCTAASLLVLMADRTQLPVAAKMQEKKP